MSRSVQKLNGLFYPYRVYWLALFLWLTLIASVVWGQTSWPGTNINEEEKVAGHIILIDPIDTDELVFRLPPWSGTMTEVHCEVYGGTSININICDGEDIGDDSCTTSILGSALTCTTSGVSDTTLTATQFAARDKVSLVLAAKTGDVISLEVYIQAEVNWP